MSIQINNKPPVCQYVLALQQAGQTVECVPGLISSTRMCAGIGSRPLQILNKVCSVQK